MLPNSNRLPGLAAGGLLDSGAQSIQAVVSQQQEIYLSVWGRVDGWVQVEARGHHLHPGHCAHVGRESGWAAGSPRGGIRVRLYLSRLL